MIFQAIAGFRLVTNDPERLVAFYQAIGFDVGEAAAPIPAADMKLLSLSGGGSRVAMSLGRSGVDLERFDNPGRPYPADATACDLMFQHLALVTDDAEAAWRRARDAGAIPISRARPVTLSKSAGGATAVKFRDPEGHPLEFIQFPKGARPDLTGTGVMGIDHSAISVSDVAASRRFYARCGLSEADATVNHGPTQDALDGLDGVRVDVVPMNPAHEPPHVEMLGYRHPVGRTMRPLAPNDVAATRIVWRSSGNGLIRDPDGHLHQLSR
ncbi:glyoxalase/bleomycin resistance protein/dioxygenase superfamily protein [Roseiarcus fermentans]|uniref:Glyoxalase/bleomycin resistance protein/dioxygenase superfamily protein n=1 Tax=Roseiarcus fermentans TaxID=1473586 RepID=A0A366F7G6_9HYPH|nr:VOC family protein [Roseiarcus fermentans]RBP09900.1 glyoxalase/bleomycin resistance protein/dioxygenase superfamily protein [Roseiarcus fermentans]